MPHGARRRPWERSADARAVARIGAFAPAGGQEVGGGYPVDARQPGADRRNRDQPDLAAVAFRHQGDLALQHIPLGQGRAGLVLALAELRRGKAPDEVVETALASISRASDSREMAGYLAAFLRG